MIRKIVIRLLRVVIVFGIGLGLAGCVIAPYYPGGHSWDSGGHSGGHHRHHDGRRW